LNGDGTSWSNIAGKLRQIDVGPDGNAWGICGDGSIFRYDGSSWVNIPGNARYIAVGANG